MSHFADDDTIALIESLKQQLAEAQKQIMVMVGCFETITNASPWEVSHGDIALKALATIVKDLSGCIICDVEPAAYMFSKGPVIKLDVWKHGGNWEPLYRAKDQKCS